MSVSLPRHGILSQHATPSSRNKHFRRRYAIEALESRTLLSTLAFLTTGNLSYQAAATTASALTLSATANDGVYTFTDTDQPISLDPTAIAAGWSNLNSHEVTGPTSSVSSITVGGTSAGQSLTVDFSGGDPLPGAGLNYDPKAATAKGAVNSLTTQGGSFKSEAYTATSATTARSPMMARRRSPTPT